MMKQKKVPMRMCVGCREMKPKRELLRVVRSPEGEISFDLTGRKSGRGAYVCRSQDCLQKAVRPASAGACVLSAGVRCGARRADGAAA